MSSGYASDTQNVDDVDSRSMTSNERQRRDVHVDDEQLRFVILVARQRAQPKLRKSHRKNMCGGLLLKSCAT